MYILRELNKGDLVRINEWRNDSDLISNLGAPYRFISIDVDNEWYENYLKKRSTTVRCAIVEKDNPNLILGLVSLTDIDFINRSAELHIMIGDKNYRDKGVGTFAVNSIVKHAFDNLNLRRIELEVLEDNVIAIHLYEKCGFEKEGLKRDAIFKNNRYMSVLIMSKLKE